MLEIIQSNLDEVRALNNVDLLICAVGYESRASHFANLLRDVNVERKYCVELVNDYNSEEKDKFHKLGFDFISTDSDLNFLFEKDLSSVIVDYSVMMKSLYSKILVTINNSNYLENTKFYFTYTHAIFEKSKNRHLRIKSIEPILLTGNKKSINHFRNTKLIVSLGYERLSITGLIEVLEIDYNDVYVIINKENDDSLHYKQCVEVNKDLLQLLKPNQIIEINFFNFNETISIMDSIFNKLKMEDKFGVLAPMSVKTFSLLSMIHSLRYSNISFYNVTSINTAPHYTKRANTNRLPTIYQIKKIASSNEIIL